MKSISELLHCGTVIGDGGYLIELERRGRVDSGSGREKSVLLMALGAQKAGAVRAMIEGPPTAQCPASLLQGHPSVDVFLDESAAAALRKQR